MKYPICIISKDRADICTTHKLLDYDGITYFYLEQGNIIRRGRVIEEK